ADVETTTDDEAPPSPLSQDERKLIGGQAAARRERERLGELRRRRNASALGRSRCEVCGTRGQAILRQRLDPLSWRPECRLLYLPCAKVSGYVNPPDRLEPRL